jgi:hypothetical protein
MEKKTQMLGKVACGVVACGMAAAAVLPSSASALTSANVTTSGTSTANSNSNNTATSNVYLFADQSKLTASVPTNIYIMVNSGGSLTCPTVTLKNTSLFSIKVSSITGTLKNSYSFTSGANDLLTLTLTPATGSAITLTAAAQTPTTTWTIANSGSNAVTLSGTLANITKNLGSASNAATISWVFAAS